MWRDCEECDCRYMTIEGGWEDELFCFLCYHDLYPCPPWCPERV